MQVLDHWAVAHPSQEIASSHLFAILRPSAATPHTIAWKPLAHMPANILLFSARRNWNNVSHQSWQMPAICTWKCLILRSWWQQSLETRTSAIKILCQTPLSGNIISSIILLKKRILCLHYRILCWLFLLPVHSLSQAAFLFCFPGKSHQPYSGLPIIKMSALWEWSNGRHISRFSQMFQASDWQLVWPGQRALVFQSPTHASKHTTCILSCKTVTASPKGPFIKTEQNVIVAIH